MPVHVGQSRPQRIAPITLSVAETARLTRLASQYGMKFSQQVSAIGRARRSPAGLGRGSRATVLAGGRVF